MSKCWVFLLFISIMHNAFSSYKEIIVVSDLDETLRQSNVEKILHAGFQLILGVSPYEGLKLILNDIEENKTNVTFYYLSNSYYALYNAQTWLELNGFPKGKIFQRKPTDRSRSFKLYALDEIFQKHPKDAIYWLIGDNVENDPLIYESFSIKYGSKVDVWTFLRDALLNQVQSSEKIRYFIHEKEIQKYFGLSEQTIDQLKSLPEEEVVPDYLLDNFRNRFLSDCPIAEQACYVLYNSKLNSIKNRIK